MSEPINRSHLQGKEFLKEGTPAWLGKNLDIFTEAVTPETVLKV